MRTISFHLALAACAFMVPGLALSQAARITSVQGTAVVERTGQAPRVLAVGDGVEQRDVINVAQKSHAMLEFKDRTQVTLRPSTVFRVDSYADSGPQQSMVLGLVKGGLRANTGDISKNNPNAVRVQTDTVILGIRGTDFDARLCAEDCGTQERTKPAAPATASAAARVIEMRGTVAAHETKNPPRELKEGSPIYETEGIVTGPDSYALVAFRDGSRVTLGSRSHLAVTRFAFDTRSPRKGQAHLKLVSGDAHVLTGELAKTGPDAFLFETEAGMIRTQGAGFSVRGPAGDRSRQSSVRRGLQLAMNAPNAFLPDTGLHITDTQDTGFGVAAADNFPQPTGDEVLVVHTWDGTVVIQTATERIEIRNTESVAITVVDGKLAVLKKPPPQFFDKVPLPNTVNVDPSALPGQEETTPESGLYVWVREGVVVMGKDQQAFEIKAGNAALATSNKLALLNAVPGFMLNDPTPRFPGGASANFVPRAFKAPDGSISRTCK